MKSGLFLGVILMLLICGCRAPKASPESIAARPQPEPILGPDGVRNNAYSLLHQLLEKQRRVSGLLLIKRERDEIEVLVKEIARASAESADQLKDFVKQDRTVLLDAFALPPAEQATREAVEATRREELLGSSGMELERHLLFSQIEALSYATHLAKVAAENDSNPARSRALYRISGVMRDLYVRAKRVLLNGSDKSAKAQNLSGP